MKKEINNLDLDISQKYVSEKQELQYYEDGIPIINFK